MNGKNTSKTNKDHFNKEFKSFQEEIHNIRFLKKNKKK